MGDGGGEIGHLTNQGSLEGYKSCTIVGRDPINIYTRAHFGPSEEYFGGGRRKGGSEGGGGHRAASMQRRQGWKESGGLDAEFRGS